MGNTIEQWRCRIGRFAQPLKCRSRLKTLTLKYMSMGLRIVLFYMLLVQCIEFNPGPPRGRGNTARGSSSSYGSRGRGVGVMGVQILHVITLRVYRIWASRIVKVTEGLQDLLVLYVSSQVLALGLRLNLFSPFRLPRRYLNLIKLWKCRLETVIRI